MHSLNSLVLSPHFIDITKTRPSLLRFVRVVMDALIDEDVFQYSQDLFEEVVSTHTDHKLVQLLLDV